MIGTDHDYRIVLIDAGISPLAIAGLSGRELDCVGNLCGIYRPGRSMKEQDPGGYAIEQGRRQWMARRLEPSTSIAGRVLLVLATALILAICANGVTIWRLTQ